MEIMAQLPTDSQRQEQSRILASRQLQLQPLLECSLLPLQAHGLFLGWEPLAAPSTPVSRGSPPLCLPHAESPMRSASALNDHRQMCLPAPVWVCRVRMFGGKQGHLEMCFREQEITHLKIRNCPQAQTEPIETSNASHEIRVPVPINLW